MKNALDGSFVPFNGADLFHSTNDLFPLMLGCQARWERLIDTLH